MWNVNARVLIATLLTLGVAISGWWSVTFRNVEVGGIVEELTVWNHCPQIR